jgi:hypothetical protein
MKQAGHTAKIRHACKTLKIEREDIIMETQEEIGV